MVNSASRHGLVSYGPQRSYLVSPLVDVLGVGGLSIIVQILFWLFSDKSASTYSISVVAYSLSFLVNWPHFLSSYQLLYGDYGDLIFKKKSFAWAAIGAPLLIIGIFTWAIMTANPTIFMFMVHAMYLSVGWHYVKQIYGVMIVSAVIQKRYFDRLERLFVLLNLYSLWAMSWVSVNMSHSKLEMDGVSYYALDLPPWSIFLTYGFTALTLMGVIITVVAKYIKTGSRPALTSSICFLTIYFWYIPALNHPLNFYLIPFFHSLQYLMFVVPLKLNKSIYNSQMDSENSKLLAKPEERKKFIFNFGGFWLLAFVLGIAGFWLIPTALDSTFPMQKIFGPTAWTFAIAIFINVHHYFIDNVIWRNDNAALKKHLVQASQQRVFA